MTTTEEETTVETNVNLLKKLCFHYMLHNHILQPRRSSVLEGMYFVLFTI